MPVYFMRAGLSGPVKIGRADDVPARMYALQTGHYETLNVVRTVEGSAAEETSFHRQFKHRHIRGEWFHWDENMLLAEAKPLHDPVVSTVTENVCQNSDADIEVTTPVRKRDILCTTVDEAIAAAGGALELSKACNLHRTSVLFWRYRDRIPANHVVAVEEKTGIPRERLRPDLYREIAPSRRTTRKEAVHV